MFDTTTGLLTDSVNFNGSELSGCGDNERTEVVRIDSRTTAAACELHNATHHSMLHALVNPECINSDDDQVSDYNDDSPPGHITDNFDNSLKPDAQFLLFQFALQQMQHDDPKKVMALRSLHLPNGSSANVLWEDYYDLHCFILENNLSESLGDRLLQTINKINVRHGVSVPLPSQFRTIKQAIRRHQNEYKHQAFVYDVYMDDVCVPPAFIARREGRRNPQADGNRGDNDCINKDTVYATGARVSVLETIATMLLSCREIDMDTQTAPSKSCSTTETPVTFQSYTPAINGERVVSDIPSAEWFRLMLNDIHHYYGDTHIGLLSVVLSYDATTLTKAIGTSGRYTTPVYVTIGKHVKMYDLIDK